MDRQELDTIDYLRKRIKEYERLLGVFYIFLENTKAETKHEKEFVRKYQKQLEEYGFGDMS